MGHCSIARILNYFPPPNSPRDPYQKSRCPQSLTKRLSLKKRLLRRLHLRLLLKLRPKWKKQKKWPKNKSSKCEILQVAAKSKISWCFYPLSSKTSDHLLKKEIMEENQTK